MRRVLVIGGGVIGLTAALRLARARYQVTLLEPSETRMAASWGNAGHIATEQVAPLASLASLRSLPRRLFARGGAVDLPLRAVRHWAPFAAGLLHASRPRRFAEGRAALAGLLARALPAWTSLANSLGRPDLVRSDGHFVVWESERTAATGMRAWLSADTGTAAARMATPAEYQRLCTLTTAPIAGALRFSGSGRISDLEELADALERAFEQAGGRIVREQATLTLQGDAVRVPGHAADVVLVTAGARSGELMRAAGHRVPMIAERGYHIRGATATWPAAMPPIVFEDRSMIVSRYRDRLQAAGFVEFDHADAPPDERKWLRLERQVGELGLAMSPPRSRWMGSRPTLPDYLPAIGRSQRAENLFYAFGHQHLGLTLAAISAELIVASIQDRQPAVDLRSFDIERFGGASRHLPGDRQGVQRPADPASACSPRPAPIPAGRATERPRSR